MPTKFKKDEIVVKRTPDGKQSKTKKRHYIHTIKQEELIKTLNATSSGKLKQKIRNELRKRGITLVRKAS